jgi:hypothetical protein
MSVEGDAPDQHLDAATLVRWRRKPTAFIEEVLHDPETGTTTYT